MLYWCLATVSASTESSGFSYKRISKILVKKCTQNYESILILYFHLLIFFTNSAIFH